MRKTLILWVDDEIDLLKPHILFLEEKGYEVVTTNNGYDAVDLVKEKNFDLIFLDEMMPGLSGLETLDKIKSVAPNLPVIMITKSEEEDIMNAAIGSKISDYLIKPVNPNQILLSIKKNIEQKRLVSEKTTTDYQTEFGKIGMAISMAATYQDWIDIYKKLVYWEVEIAKSPDSGLHEVLKLQKDEANNAFAKFVKSKYTSWFSQNDQPKPLISPNIFKSTVFPLLENGEKVVFILIDNFRFDQWKTIAPVINEYFTIEKEDLYYAILPTSTQYARNAIFSGLMPLEISQLFPELWTEEDDDEGKNLYEEELLRKQINRNGEKCKMQFEKILNLKAGKKLVDNLAQMMNNDLSVIVYNFVDMLSHARTEMEMIKELASDEAAYRSITLSWFQHSPLFEFMKGISHTNLHIILTTDHGTIRVNNPVKVVGDKRTTTNLRFKQGKNLNYNSKEVLEIKDPTLVHLPKDNLTSTYIFANRNDFLVYPNNYNYYVNYYKNTFQHGGISMEEMIIPLITLKTGK